MKKGCVNIVQDFRWRYKTNRQLNASNWKSKDFDILTQAYGLAIPSLEFIYLLL